MHRALERIAQQILRWAHGGCNASPVEERSRPQTDAALRRARARYGKPFAHEPGSTYRHTPGPSYWTAERVSALAAANARRRAERGVSVSSAEPLESTPTTSTRVRVVGRTDGGWR